MITVSRSVSVVWILACVFLYGGSPLYSQDTASAQSKVVPNTAKKTPGMAKRISANLDSVALDKAIQIVAAKASLEVLFEGSVIERYKKIVSGKFDNVPVDKIFEQILSGTKLQVIPHTNRVIFIREVDSKDVRGDNGAIEGIATDASTNQPIIGARLMIEEISRVGYASDKGFFRLSDIPPGTYRIRAHAVGYNVSRVTVNVRSKETSHVSLKLSPVTTTLSEVVTTVTGKQRRAEIPNDIVKIEADKIRERSPVRNVIDLIEAAQVPGVLIQHSNGDPGSPSRIRIRGIGSISQSNDPVMIVDGVWIDSKTSYPSRLDNIDPASIETIEIVRGPSAATLYGQDASNGVIVITTKKGKTGPTRWNLSYKRDWGQTYGSQPLVYSGVGKSMGNSNFQTRCSIGNILAYQCNQDTVLIYDPNNPLVSKEGVETNNRYSAQVDGGGQNVTYMFTFSTANTIGIRRVNEIDKIRQRLVGYQTPSDFIKPSNLSIKTITSNVVITPQQNLTLGLTITGAQSHLKDNSLNSSWFQIGQQGAGVGAQYGLDTVFTSALGNGNIYAEEAPKNSINGLISGNLQYRPNNFVVTANIGAEKNSSTNSTYSRPTRCYLNSGCTQGLGTRSEGSNSGSLYTVRLNASTSINLGTLSRFIDLRPSIGGDYKRTDNYSTSISKRDIPVGDRSLAGGVFNSASNSTTENALAGWYLNSTIGLFKRIYFDVGIRQDIGSAITSSQNAAYPKIGGSWLVSDESFWRVNPFINTLRLRSAIGHSAVQPDVRDIDGRFINDVDFIDGVFVNTVNLSGLGNNSLEPERAVELELGFDADILDNRLNLVGTYAHKENKNTLVVRSLPGSFGGGSRKENIAKVRNRNFEFSANGRVIETSTMLLAISYTLTLSDNKVVRLGEGVSPFTSQESRIQAGYPIGAAWGRMLLGYDDLNGDGMLASHEVIISDSVVYRGWSQPRSRAGYGISLTLANQIVLDSRFASQSKYVQTYRNKTGPGTEDTNAPLSVQAVAYTATQKPVSDIRWTSASITYNLPNSLLKKIGGRSLAISIQGSNLNLWTNYAGRDPGVNSGVGELTIDNGYISPRPRLYVLDFKMGL